MNDLTANDLLNALAGNSGTIDYIGLLGEGYLVMTAKALTSWEPASDGKIEMTDANIDWTITSGFNGAIVYAIVLFSSNVNTTDYLKRVATYILPTPITVNTDDVFRVSVLELGFN
jgi:hypothetical protein